MFSQDERCIYQKNQLMEVVCQLRFPTILSIGTKEPAEFQDEIRDVFPRYEVRQEQLPAKVTPIPGQKPKVRSISSICSPRRTVKCTCVPA